MEKLLLGVIFPNMAARVAKMRGGKVEISKEHIEIDKIAHFQNSRKTFQGNSFFFF